MLEAGFNTKSNFNKEFLRATGLSPSEYKKQIFPE
jgi:AraC-like DNA-binding protein